MVSNIVATTISVCVAWTKWFGSVQSVPGENHRSCDQQQQQQQLECHDAASINSACCRWSTSSLCVAVYNADNDDDAHASDWRDGQCQPAVLEASGDDMMQEYRSRMFVLRVAFCASRIAAWANRWPLVMQALLPGLCLWQIQSINKPTVATITSAMCKTAHYSRHQLTLFGVGKPTIFHTDRRIQQ